MKLRFPDFMTTAQDGGRLSALHTGRLYILYIRTSRFLPFQKDVHMTFVLFFSATICVFIVCLFFLSRVVAFFFGFSTGVSVPSITKTLYSTLLFNRSFFLVMQNLDVLLMCLPPTLSF